MIKPTKYYEMFVDTYYLNKEPKIYFTQVAVVRDTEHLLLISGAHSYRQRLYKKDLCKVVEKTGYCKYIIYPEGQVEQALEKMRESFEREYSYAKKRETLVKLALKEVNRIGKEKHN